MAIWEKTNNSLICQGDRLNSIAVPLIHHSFPQVDSDGSVPVDVQPMDVIILTQSCELENSKASLVVVAGIYTIEDFEELNASFQSKGRWESVAKGRFDGLHLLHGHGEPTNGRECLVVDFRQIVSLPVEYVRSFVQNCGERWRLGSPYLENMSQAFGRYFMRVALPIDLPRDFVKR
jgi:hypothetical protein